MTATALSKSGVTRWAASPPTAQAPNSRVGKGVHCWAWIGVGSSRGDHAFRHGAQLFWQISCTSTSTLAAHFRQTKAQKSSTCSMPPSRESKGLVSAQIV